MFCPNCGYSMPDDAAVCSNCGTPLAAQAPTQPTQAQPQVPRVKVKDPNAAKRNKLIMLCALAGVVVVVLIVVIVLVVGGGGGYGSPEKAAEAFVSSRYSGDMEAYLDCLPEFRVRDIASDYGLTVDNRDLLLTILKLNYSTATVTITSSEVYESPSTLAEGISDLKYYGATADEIADMSEFSLVRVIAIVDGDVRTYTVFCVKMGGSWYPAYRE